MEFGIEQCAMLIMKSRKRQMTEGIGPPNQRKIKRLEQETYKYLGIVEADIIKRAEIKEKNLLKKYLRKTRKLLEIT